MTPLGLVEVAAAGVVAGAVNAIAGAGSLLTYPVLVAVGLPAKSANVTNDIGVVPGNLTGAFGLRKDLVGQAPLLAWVLPVASVGSIAGGLLLLLAPASTFEAIVPYMLLVASALTAVQPWLLKRLQRGDAAHRGWFVTGIWLVSVYGGYFGTGIGLLFLAVLGLFVPEPLRRLNATKQLLALFSNGIAGALFALFGPVHWLAALVLAASTAVGGPIGARLSHVIPAGALRIVVCLIGAGAAVYLWVR
jgi:uncharacterized membrane protein YfcA